MIIKFYVYTVNPEVILDTAASEELLMGLSFKIANITNIFNISAAEIKTDLIIITMSKKKKVI